MCANSEGSGETARVRRLAWSFAGRLCDSAIISWAGLFISLQVCHEAAVRISFYCSKFMIESDIQSFLLTPNTTTRWKAIIRKRNILTSVQIKAWRMFVAAVYITFQWQYNKLYLKLCTLYFYRLFIQPLYCGIFTEQSLVLNRRRVESEVETSDTYKVWIFCLVLLFKLLYLTNCLSLTAEIGFSHVTRARLEST